MRIPRSRALWILPLLSAAAIRGEEVGFVEDFALAADRERILEKLAPGSEDAYFYRCLHLQNSGRLGEVPAVLDAWVARHGQTPRVDLMRNRQALLGYGQDPQGSLDYLVRRLGIGFNHARQLPGEALAFPTALPPDCLDLSRLIQDALGRHPNLDGFTPEGLPLLLGKDLGAVRRRDLLGRLRLPDVEGLAELVVQDLRHPRSAPFGSLPIHRQLLTAQLDACLALMPELLNQPGFVETYLPRLAPASGEDWRRDASVREAYLDRLWAFAQRLGAAHAGLKASVLYHRLVHDRGQGVLDRERFLAYLRLPRAASYVPPEYLQRPEHRGCIAQFNVAFPTGLPAVGNDEPLVRDILLELMASDEDYRAFAPYVREDLLRELFAEAKLLSGAGDPERWASLLDDPARLQALKDRVDIAFAPANPSAFGPAEPVVLDVDMKNVPSLLVKVYALNTLALSRAGREPELGVDLDGLPAVEERSLAFAEPPLRRLRRRLEFPALDRRGAYVVELIGNGRISRALVRKGRLELLGRLSSAGHVFTVLDETRRALKDASLWMDGQAFAADGKGEILVPFAAQKGTKAVSVEQGGFGCLARFEHLQEAYALEALIHVEREALIRGNTAAVLVRPVLRAQGAEAPLAALERPVLEIRAVTADGVESQMTVSPFPLTESRESKAEFLVPDRLVRLDVTLRGEVRRLGDGKMEALSSARSFRPNGTEATTMTEDLHLARTAEGYVLMALGRNGEPRPGRALRLALSHRAFRQPVEVSLQTDAQGRAVLGRLEGVTAVRSLEPAEPARHWLLERDEAVLPHRVHLAAGQDLRLPYLGKPGRPALALLEKRGEFPAEDRFDRLAVEDGFLLARGLAAGEYALVLKEAGQAVQVLVGSGEVREGWSMGPCQGLELGCAVPLQIAEPALDAESLALSVLNATPATRLVVTGTRFLPARDPFQALARSPRTARSASFPASLSEYVSGRRIGDEQRYILERRQAQKFPGNMLERPSLLLAPWALRDTDTSRQDAAPGDGLFGGRSGGAQGSSLARGGGRRGDPGESCEGGLDFLALPAVVLENLVPDKDGRLRIPLKALSGCQRIGILALDGDQAVSRSLALPERPLETRDLRLAKAFDPAGHRVERRQAEVLAAGDRRPLGSGGHAAYDSLERVYALLAAMNPDAHLRTFAFLLEWPGLKEERKRALYAEHACHEMNVFLSRKDPAFFTGVVRPFLANKLEKAFLDEWLLDRDLKGYLEPRRFARLNAVEKVLLAQRLPGEREGILRHLADRLELSPPDGERRDRLFRAALMSRALEETEGGGIRLGFESNERDSEKAMEEKLERLEGAKKLKDLEVPKSPAPSPAMDAETTLRSRARKAQSYRPLERTREWAESRWYRLPREQETADLVGIDPFWMDLARWDGKAGFLSAHLPEAAGGFPEMMLALAFLDLPWKAPASRVEQGEFVAAGPTVLFLSRIEEAGPKAEGAAVMVAQNLFRADDRIRYEGAEQVERFVSGEFLTGVVYGCQVVLTNPSASRQRLEVLLQVPQGAIALGGIPPTRGQSVQVEPFQARALEYAFYFPRPGTFPHYGVRAAKGPALAAWVQGEALKVLDRAGRPDPASWEHLSQAGTSDEVLAYLKANNLERVALPRMAWRLADPAFFKEAVDLLARRHVFEPTVWSYGFKHGDAAAMREFMLHREDFLAACGRRLRSPLMDLDEGVLGGYEHLEYAPLVNPRAHPLGGSRGILNAQFLGQYRGLLDALGYEASPRQEDLLAVTYYLLLQDRVAEAKAFFARLEPARLETRLQYDYLAAYLRFYEEDPKGARRIAEAYREYPVDTWRRRFQEVLAQADEIEGRRPAARLEPAGAQQANAGGAAEAASLELAVESERTLLLRARGLKACRVSYYPMDLEFLFSKAPFAQAQGADLAVVQPAQSVEVALPARKDLVKVPVPGRFLKGPVLVEATAGGIRRTAMAFAHNLALELAEPYGHLRLTRKEGGKPVAKAYVKVYARTRGGEVRFHKDGYTDLRGRFDYAATSTGGTEEVERFAILVLSEADGGLVWEAAPPKP